MKLLKIYGIYINKHVHTKKIFLKHPILMDLETLMGAQNIKKRQILI